MDAVRKHVLDLLRSRNAHADFDSAVARFPVRLRGVKTRGVPYTAWQLVEHMRLAQWDILEFSRNPRHVSPAWPEGYWPAAESPPSGAAWTRSLRAFRADLAELEKLVANPRRDLYTPFRWGEGQTLLREALLVADHNAYHVGQLVLLRRLLGAWPG